MAVAKKVVLGKLNEKEKAAALNEVITFFNFVFIYYESQNFYKNWNTLILSNVLIHS